MLCVHACVLVTVTGSLWRTAGQQSSHWAQLLKLFTGLVPPGELSTQRGRADPSHPSTPIRGPIPGLTLKDLRPDPEVAPGRRGRSSTGVSGRIPQSDSAGRSSSVTGPVRELTASSVDDKKNTKISWLVLVKTRGPLWVNAFHRVG